MAKMLNVNHIAIVVPEIDNALSFWRDSLGLALSHIEDVPEQKSKVAFLPLGGSEIELVEPTTDDSGVYKFLTERGPGMHHICFQVDDINEMITDLKSKGVRLINENPMQLEGRKVAFIHPKSANGVLVELFEQD